MIATTRLGVHAHRTDPSHQTLPFALEPSSATGRTAAPGTPAAPDTPTAPIPIDATCDRLDLARGPAGRAARPAGGLRLRAGGLDHPRAPREDVWLPRSPRRLASTVARRCTHTRAAPPRAAVHAMPPKGLPLYSPSCSSAYEHPSRHNPPLPRKFKIQAGLKLQTDGLAGGPGTRLATGIRLGVRSVGAPALSPQWAGCNDVAKLRNDRDPSSRWLVPGSLGGPPRTQVSNQR